MARAARGASLIPTVTKVFDLWSARKRLVLLIIRRGFVNRMGPGVWVIAVIFPRLLSFAITAIVFFFTWQENLGAGRKLCLASDSFVVARQRGEIRGPLFFTRQL